SKPPGARQIYLQCFCASTLTFISRELWVSGDRSYRSRSCPAANSTAVRSDLLATQSSQPASAVTQRSSLMPLDHPDCALDRCRPSSNRRALFGNETQRIRIGIRFGLL